MQGFERPSVPVALLDRKHREYQANFETWSDIELLYGGGTAIRQSAVRFLKPRPSEPPDLFQSRLERFTYTNVIGTCVGWYGSKLFREDPTISLRDAEGNERSPEPGSYYSQFQRDSDRAGTSFVDYFRKTFLDLVLYRQAWLLVDLPRLKGARTRQEELAAGVDRPYLVRYAPQEVINWQTDEAGNLEWAVVAIRREQGGFLELEQRIDRWYYFDKEGYRLYERVFDPSKGSAASGVAMLVDEGPHALTGYHRVPLRRIEIPEGMWLANRAYLPALDHLNAENQLAWALMIANLAMPIIFSGKDVKPTYSEVGFLQLDPGDQFQWSEHPGNSFVRQAERIASVREEIYRSLYLLSQGRDSGASATVQSALSKQIDLRPAYDLLDGFGDVLRPAMEKVLRDVSDARGDVGLHWNVRGFQFEQRLTLDEVQILQRVLEMGIASPTLRRELHKRTAQAALPDAPPELRGSINREIDGIQ